MRHALKRLVGIYAALGVVGALAGVVIAPPNNAHGPLQGIDNWANAFILAHATSSPPLLRVADDIEILGKIEILVPFVAVITVALWAWGFRIRAFAPALSLAGTGLLVEPLKHLIARPGPVAWYWVHLAWPSGHTAGVTAVVVPLAALAWTTRRWWWPSVVAAGFILAVGISMLVVQGHWLTDVIGAAVLAGVWGVAVAVLLPDRIGAGAEAHAPRQVEATTQGQRPQPPPWHRPAEWMS